MKTSTSHLKRPPLGEILLDEGRITQAELDAALAYKEERGVKLGQALVALHLVTQSDLARALKAQGKFHCLELTPEIVDPAVARLLGAEISRRMQAVAVNRIAGIVTVAMEDPSESYNIDAISMQLCAPVLAVHADPERIERCIEFVFARSEPWVSAGEPEAFRSPEFVPNTIDLTIAGEQDGNLDERATNLVNAVIDEALMAGATDVHVEPEADALSVRFRIDGRLEERARLSVAMSLPLIARLRALGGLELCPGTHTEQGAVEAAFGPRRVWLDISIAPSWHGSTAVVRLREIGRPGVDSADLGLGTHARVELDRILSRRAGLLLVAGAPRSGRTTTLYALARDLSTADKKVVIVDRTPAFALPRVVQIPYEAKSGAAATLRAALRHEPDVLVVGEITDSETAHIALLAALEGRLVLSSVTAFDSAEAVSRLVDLGLERSNVSAGLQGVLAQCLVRRICAHCRREAEPGRERLQRRADEGPFFEGAGCDRCGQAGYRGSVALFELMHMDDDLARLVRSGACADELRTAAVARGMTRFVAEGLRKALAGETTLSEMRRRGSLRDGRREA